MSEADRHARNKDLLKPLRSAMYDFPDGGVPSELEALLAPDAIVRLAHPIGEMTGPAELWERAYAPLLAALPDLERRDTIVIAGATEAGANWVGACGAYMGTFDAPWLDIPPTGHAAAMRYHEFFRFEDGRVAEIQALWDIPELMMQAGAWPLVPSLGREWQVPGPASQDGIVGGSHDPETGRASTRHVTDMLTAMKRHPAEGGPEMMEMERFWHPRMNWYGPSGIGTGRGVRGFRHWHQIPFLAAMPDRGTHLDEITYHFFGERDYVGVTGWPNMIQTLTAPGWLGLPPTGQRLTMRSLDFWRLENGRIRENWVLVDLLDMYHQLRIDPLERMREFNKARVPGAIPYPAAEVR